MNIVLTFLTSNSLAKLNKRGILLLANSFISSIDMILVDGL